MPLQSALAQVGVAKQTAKGSAAANPTFAQGVTSGSVVTVEVAQALEDHTSSARITNYVNRTGVIPGIDFSCRAHSKTLGLYLLGALGSVTTTGTGPYTHNFALADDLPYLTAFGKLAGNNYAVNDVKVDEIEISFSENDPLEVAISGMGTTVNYAATFTPTTDDTAASYFASSSGTFQIDVDSGTPVSAKIKSGSLNIKNNVETIMLSGAIAPSDVFPGRQEIECSFDIVPDDLTDWRAIVTGTTTGTTASAAPVYGSFNLVFNNGTDTLTLNASRVAFTTDFPEADPAGGSITLSLEGLVVKPTSATAALTATLINTQASY